VGKVPAAGDRDLRGGRRIGDIGFDAAFTDLDAPDGTAGGRYEHTLAAPDGRSVTLWADPEFSFVHVFISTTYPGVARAVAVEPMTAPADAFNSGEGLRWLEPGATFGASWGISPRLA
jgi:aldose 1-epimerase